ncbi:MAG: hypothetical protein ACQESC_02460 [Nanobdellota archaeon]
MKTKYTVSKLFEKLNLSYQNIPVHSDNDDSSLLVGDLLLNPSKIRFNAKSQLFNQDSFEGTVPTNISKKLYMNPYFHKETSQHIFEKPYSFDVKSIDVGQSGSAEALFIGLSAFNSQFRGTAHNYLFGLRVIDGEPLSIAEIGWYSHSERQSQIISMGDDHVILNTANQHSYEVDTIAGQLALNKTKGIVPEQNDSDIRSFEDSIQKYIMDKRTEVNPLYFNKME